MVLDDEPFVMPVLNSGLVLSSIVYVDAPVTGLATTLVTKDTLVAPLAGEVM